MELSRLARPPDTPRTHCRVPIRAPNVVLILLDGVDFGAISNFGGPVATPVSPDYASPFAFTAKIESVRVDVN
jgi:hypothetical protein